MIFDSNGKLQVSLAASPATTSPNFCAGYVTTTQTTAESTGPYAAVDVTSGTAWVDVIAAPASGKTNTVLRLTIHNGDTVSHTVSVRLYVSANGRMLVKRTILPGESLNYDQANGWQVVAGPTAWGTIVLRDEKSSGTDGGTATSGSWQTRTLNTEAVDSGGNCSLSSNAFTLDAGTYEIIATAPAISVAQHQSRLQNTSDGTTTIVGTSELSQVAGGAGDCTRSVIRGRFTITASKTFEIQHRVTSTLATYGYGRAASLGTEVYTEVMIRKVA